MKTPVFEGAGVAIVTPFNKKGIDFDSLGNLIDFQINNGTDSIIICGTTGESSTMTDEEHKAAIEFAVKHTNRRVPVVAGTGSNDTTYAVELSKHAESVGADALLHVTPYYNKCSQKGLVKHFTAAADAVKIPVIVYDVPSRTGMTISIEAYAELAKHPNINGTKEACGSLSHIAKIRRACGDDMNIWSGEDDQVVPMMSLGGKGVISVVSNIMPKEMHEMCAYALKGDFVNAGRMQIELLDVCNNMFIDVNPIPVKTALNLMGMNAGLLRLPLCEPDEKGLAVIKACLKNHNLI